MGQLLDIPAILLTLAVVFGLINHWFVRLPRTIGLVLIAMLSALAYMAIDFIAPTLGLVDRVQNLLEVVDLNKTLMEGMLSFLLFAGALHVNLNDLLSRKWLIGTLASLGVVLSTLLNGLGFWGLSQLFGLHFSLPICLVFGALISPTDPVAVLATLKTVAVPKELKAVIAGESLFNDGVAVVVFSLLVTVAFGVSGHGEVAHGATAAAVADTAHTTVAHLPSIQEVLMLFATEALGGAALGLAAGLIAFYAMRSLDDYVLEVMISLALVTATYAIALHLHLSGPIAMVIAGLLIGNQGATLAMSAKTKEHLELFWELLDEILNAVLFLLIGVEIIAITLALPLFGLAVAVIALAIAVRFVAIAVPVALFRVRIEVPTGHTRILWWAGLRGGISVALALSLPDFEGKDIILAVTYAVVIFSILAQGLSIDRLLAYFYPDAGSKAGSSRAK